jgi:hypothetical protein
MEVARGVWQDGRNRFNPVTGTGQELIWRLLLLLLLLLL